MAKAPMKKSTATISLVLLGTAMTVVGCQSRARDEEKKDQPATGGHGGGVVGTGVFSGSRGVGGSGTSAAPSARGGFGGFGRGGFGF